MMSIDFSKIQATGNDFVVLDFSAVPKEFFSTANIVRLCNRHMGIGADGIIAIEKITGHAFKFHYYNADGSRGEMCANGCRAAITYALEKNWVKIDELFTFLADDGIHTGMMQHDTIQITVLANSNINKIDVLAYDLPDWVLEGYKLNTGVPHLVLLCRSELKKYEIENPGRLLRYHNDFKPQGTNVNFVEILSNNEIFVRTYERGVENETLSCGTGITAAALVVNTKTHKIRDGISVQSAGGNLLVFQEDDDILIKGPAKKVFDGQIQI